MTKDEALTKYEAQKTLLRKYREFFKTNTDVDELIALVERADRVYSHLELSYYLKKAFDFTKNRLDIEKIADGDPMELGVAICDTLVARFKALNPVKEFPQNNTMEIHQNIVLCSFVKDFGGMTLPKEERLFEEDVYDTRKKASVKEIYGDKVFSQMIEAIKNRTASEDDLRVMILEYRAIKRIISEEGKMWRVFHSGESERRIELYNVIKSLLNNYFSVEELDLINVNKTTDIHKIKERGALLLSGQKDRLFGTLI